MADGFLGRWSKRKLQGEGAKDGEDLPVSPSTPVSGPAASPGAGIAAQGAMQAANSQALSQPPMPAGANLQQDPGTVGAAESVPPPLTLQDAEALTPTSDFKPFMARGVAPAVKNAAMKKLFADPHFNVMDRLDTYIDDYSKPDPIPAAMLRKMVGSQLLGLFDDVPKAEPPTGTTATAASDHVPTTGATRDDTYDPPPASVAPSSAADDDAAHPPHSLTDTDKTSPPAPPHPAADARASQDPNAHTDMRLQPDDAAPTQDAGRRAG